MSHYTQFVLNLWISDSFFSSCFQIFSWKYLIWFAMLFCIFFSLSHMDLGWWGMSLGQLSFAPISSVLCFFGASCRCCGQVHPPYWIFMCVAAEKNTQAQQYIFMLSDCKIFSSTKFPKEIFFQFPFSSSFRNFVISICFNHRALNSSAVNSVSSEFGVFFQYSCMQCEHRLSKDLFCLHSVCVWCGGACLLCIMCLHAQREHWIHWNWS